MENPEYVNEENADLVLQKLRDFANSYAMLNLVIIVAYIPNYPIGTNEGDKLVNDGLLVKKEDRYIMPDYVRSIIKSSINEFTEYISSIIKAHDVISD